MLHLIGKGRNLIVKTFSIVAANWWFYLFFIAILLVLTGLGEAGVIESGMGTISTVLWLLFARYAHRAALFDIKFGDRNPDGTRDRNLVGFFFKGLALTFLPVILAMPILIWTISRLPAGHALSVGDILPYVGIFLVFYALTLSIAGTWMAASVYRQDMGLGAALKRGTRYFFPVLLWVVPTILVCCLAGAAVVIVGFALHSDLSVFTNGNIRPVAVVINAVNFAVQSLALTLVCVVLCHYYLKGKGIQPSIRQKAEAPVQSGML